MTRMQELKRDYKLTSEGYREAKLSNEKDIMKRLAEDLVRIADQMEYES